jgi:chemotaxis protein MotB
VSHERWLVSYADFITLLFAFFVVMYAFAKAGEKKQAQVSQAIDTAFRSMGIFHDHPGEHANQIDGHIGALDSSPQVAPVMHEDVESPAKIRDDLQRLQRSLTSSLSSVIAGRGLSISMGRDGLVISLREAGFFQSGSATPEPGTRAVLEKIGRALADSGLDVRVEGHTDNIPVHTPQFDSNWELSAARATAIARILLEVHAVSPEHLSAAGFGEYHPVASNETAEGRAQNRRVDLVITPRTKIDFSLEAPRTGGDTVWKRITEPE